MYSLHADSEDKIVNSRDLNFHGCRKLLASPSSDPHPQAARERPFSSRLRLRPSKTECLQTLTSCWGDDPIIPR